MSEIVQSFRASIRNRTAFYLASSDREAHFLRPEHTNQNWLIPSFTFDDTALNAKSGDDISALCVPFSDCLVAFRHKETSEVFRLMETSDGFSVQLFISTNDDEQRIWAKQPFEFEYTRHDQTLSTFVEEYSTLSH